ncbi:MAG: copper homeostasis protein CutC [Muribaculaceae bacterium]|nr:copper homeostasis protein CutC [Muribaculaceae bacterium]
MTTPILEICAADIDSAYAAVKGGANRIELCCALSEGGLTPSLGMIEEALDVPGCKVNVLIRPRTGDFLYSQAEVRTMVRDIDICRKIGVNGVVCGALTPEGEIDTETCLRMTYMAGDLHKTFHRAFDMCRDPRQAVRDIIELGFDRILTSGHAPTAMEGAELIRRLQEEFPEITFIAAGGVTPDNAAEIVRLTGVREIHASAKTTVQSRMTYRNPAVSMGTPGTDEFSRNTTSSDIVRMINDQLSMIN